ncbi:MAG: hypothetical protein HY302_04410, partial [Opitutae bacterium]|nr:hypothetical protein [Opitutae bacterium]
MIKTYSNLDIGTNFPVWTPVQDSDGVLYFGADRLLRFDGERWTKFSLPGPGARALRALEFGSDGRLWAGANDEIGWFDRQTDGRFHYHSIRNLLPPGTPDLGDVWNVFAEGAGASFVSREKILRWDGEKIESWDFPNPTRLAAYRVNGVVYFHHRPSGLYALRKNGPELVIPSSALGDFGIMWLEARGDGFLFANSKGLFKFAGGRLEPFAPAVADFLSRNILTCALRL